MCGFWGECLLFLPWTSVVQETLKFCSAFDPYSGRVVPTVMRKDEVWSETNNNCE